MAACDSSGKKDCVWLWYQARGMRSQAVRGVAWERPARGWLVLSESGWRGNWEGGRTYGLRGCCRRRRARVVGFAHGFARGFGLEGLRFRIGCARRRMSRRGWCERVVGLPWWTVGYWECLVILGIGCREFKVCRVESWSTAEVKLENVLELQWKLCTALRCAAASQADCKDEVMSCTDLLGIISTCNIAVRKCTQ
jgi:hypothetical protein